MAISDNWAKRPTKYSSELIDVIDRYLYGSLSVGASWFGEGFPSALGIRSTALAEAWLKQLYVSGSPPTFFDSGKAVVDYAAKRMQDQKLWGVEEYYACSRSRKKELIEQIKALPECYLEDNDALEREAKKLVERRFIEIDSVYRHLRNALAHGCFRVIAGDGMFFFDCGRVSSELSAVAYLKYSTLDRWYKIACNRAKKRL